MTKSGVYQAGASWDFVKNQDFVIAAEELRSDADWTMDNMVLIHPETEEQVPVF